MQYELQAKGCKKSSLIISSEGDLSSMKTRLHELEEESRFMDEVKLMERKQEETRLLQCDYIRSGPKKSRQGKEGTIHPCQENTRNMELEDAAVGGTARSRMRCIECTETVLCSSQSDSRESIATVNTLQALQDVYQWTGGSSVTIDTVLRDAACTFTSHFAKTHLESLPASHADERCTVDALDELFATPQPILLSMLDGASTDIGQRVDMHLSAIPEVPCVTTPLAKLGLFKFENPMVDLKQNLKGTQNVLVQIFTSASQLQNQQKRLLLRLQTPSKTDDIEGVASEVINVAEQRAACLENGMAVICERWPLIEKAEEELKHKLSSFENETEKLLTVLRGMQEQHHKQADLIKSDSEKLEATFAQKDAAYSGIFESDGLWLADSLKALEGNSERIDEMWMHVCEMAEDICRLQDERLHSVGKHVERIRLMHSRQYDSRMLDSVANEHLKLLENLYNRHSTIEQVLEAVSTVVSGALGSTQQLVSSCLDDIRTTLEDDAASFSKIHIGYCDLVGDLLLRRRNRLGMIDVEGGLLKMKVDTASIKCTSPTHHATMDLLELSRLKEEKLRVVAYISDWAERLVSQKAKHKMIVDRCNLPDVTQGLFDRLEEAKEEYDAKQKELFCHMKDLIEGYQTFAEETNSCDPIKLTNEEYRKQLSEAMGIGIARQISTSWAVPGFHCRSKK